MDSTCFADVALLLINLLLMELLVILSRFPYPLEKGDKLRAFKQIKELSRHHQINLFALSDCNVDNASKRMLEQYCKNIKIHYLRKSEIARNVIKAFLNGKPLQVGYFFSRKAKDELEKFIEDIRPAHIYCQLARTAEYARGIKSVRKTIDYQDSFSKSAERRALASRFPIKALFMLESRRMSRYEAEIFADFDNKTIISAQDRNEITHPEKEKIQIIPNGVDMDYFQPAFSEKIYDILFIGNMSYAPNIDAVRFIANEIFSALGEKMSKIRFLISGADPAPLVKSLKSNQIEIKGWVDDIRQSYASAKIFVAPMRLGAGLQNKLLQAMAMKIPCITSELANNALGAEDGKEILIGRTPDEYARNILFLLENPIEAAHIADNAFDFVKKNYNWTEITKNLSNIFDRK